MIAEHFSVFRPYSVSDIDHYPSFVHCADLPLGRDLACSMDWKHQDSM